MDENRLTTVDLIMVHSPWLKLDQVDWSAISSGIKPKFYEKNTNIYHQQQYSDYIYIVESGRVRLSIYSRNGEEKCLTIADRGCIFGEVSGLDGYPNFANATAVIDSYLYPIPKERFKEELERNHDLCLKIVKVLVRKMRLLASQVEELSFDDAYYRVINTLVYLAEQYGINTKNGCKIGLKFTHQEMANLTGLCRVTVSNVFRSLSKENMIGRENGFVIVKDVDELYRYLGMANPGKWCG